MPTRHLSDAQRQRYARFAPATRRLTSSRDIFIWIGIPNETFEKPYVTWPFHSAAWAYSRS
jgi:hypothetical protein